MGRNNAAQLAVHQHEMQSPKKAFHIPSPVPSSVSSRHRPQENTVISPLAHSPSHWHHCGPLTEALELQIAAMMAASSTASRQPPPYDYVRCRFPLVAVVEHESRRCSKPVELLGAVIPQGAPPLLRERGCPPGIRPASAFAAAALVPMCRDVTYG